MSEPSDPISRFAAAFQEATRPDLPESTAFVLATTGADGKPSARVVLLKAFDDRGFVFYTNLESRKAKELMAVRHAALCFYWPLLKQQVRVEGSVERISDGEADAYFATRPRGAQIAAWASKQSTPLTSRLNLEKKFMAFQQEYSGREVPRPRFWSGFRVIPERMEFWEFREDRLHERTLYTRDNGRWVMQNLYP
ncbi:MAG: pyridoxamine 5'-phosphate oxidase [Bacteroidota bacterium]